MIDDDDDVVSIRRSNEEAAAEETRERGRRWLRFWWAIAGVCSLSIVPVSFFAGDNFLLGLLLWALVSLATPCALAFAFSRQVQFRRELPRPKALVVLVIVMLVLLVLGLFRAVDLARRIW